MRFAYIDSQGKEVEIPSVDALRLRIELGAIVDSTIFHDANTGKWAPAAEHEIYRTLQRELAELDAGGFTAPPPAVPSPAVRRPPSPAQGQTGGPGSPEAPGAGEDFLLGFDVELVPEHPEAHESPPGTASASEVESGAEETKEAEVRPSPEAAGAGGAPEEGEEDFLLSEEWDEEDAPEMEDAGDTVPASLEAGEDLPDWAAPPAFGDAPPDLGMEPSGPELEENPMEPPPPTGGMDLEAPLSDYDADQPPEWMRRESPADWAGPPDEGTVAREVTADEMDTPGPRPERRPRSAPPPRKLTRARTPGAGRVLSLLAVLAVAAVGVWYGSGYLAGLLGAGGPGARGASIPSLPAPLQSRMTALTERAAETLTAELARLPERESLPAAPNREWLGGAYLAGPSRFPDVPQYWESVQAFVDAAERAEDDLFRAAFDAALQESTLAGEDAERVRERGLAGWEAAAPDRRAVHGELRAVADASIALHEFLLANEGQISYEPAAGGVSRDPVLEAVPASEALGVAMWDRVGAITGALDTMGFLETVETGGLLGAYLERLRTRAVR